MFDTAADCLESYKGMTKTWHMVHTDSISNTFCPFSEVQKTLNFKVETTF